jgi:acetoacetyl-CoA synthetase
VIFLAPDGYWYNGKPNSVIAKVEAVVAKLPSVRQTILVDYLGTARQAAPPSRAL